MFSVSMHMDMSVLICKYLHFCLRTRKLNCVEEVVVNIQAYPCPPLLPATLLPAAAQWSRVDLDCRARVLLQVRLFFIAQ